MSGTAYARICRWVRSSDGQLMIRCLLSVYLLGLAAHAYGFLGPIFSHDSLTAFYASPGENEFKVALGRMFVPVYRALSHGSFALPWLIGLLALLWIGLSVYLVARMFRMRSLPMIAFTAGIFVTNATVSAMTATYVNELDIDMFALLAATLSAWCWHRGGLRGLVPGVLFGVLALGLYQSYICVTITLIMISCIMRLLEHDSEKAVFMDGLKGIAMLLASAILYFAVLKLSVLITGVSLESGTNNSVTNISRIFSVSPLYLLMNAYVKFFKGCARYALRYSGFPMAFILIVNLLLFALAAAAFLRALFSRRYTPGAKVMLLLLCLLLPLGMNFTNVLNATSHTLMHYAFSFIYLIALLFVRHALHRQPLPAPRIREYSTVAFAVLMALVLLSNIQASNVMYVKKDLDRQSTISTMTRIADHMEAVEEYEAGVTPVAFCNYWGFKREPSVFDRYDRITGMQLNLQVTTYLGPYQSYFDYILNEPILLVDSDDTITIAATDEVQRMPVYPNPGYIRMVDDTLVVKLG